jgi:mRNA interferase MazF
MEKRFQEWIQIKEKLDSKENLPPFVKEKELWWFSAGENVGIEISGKSTDFSRPGLVLKRLSQHLFLIAPTTSKTKRGSWFVPINFNNQTTYLCLHQMRTIDYRRIFNYIGKISQDDFRNVKKRFRALYN